MKKLLILIVICCAQNISSQTIKKDDILTIDEPVQTTYPQGAIPNDDNNVYNTAGIDVKPEFPGGSMFFDKFIEQNFNIP
jgi:periplasmic protein TonB